MIDDLGAQSHVAVSFESPEYTANSDALGTLRILEAVRILGLPEKTRIYEASTSALYGLLQEIPQKESYGMVACNGVLFNHESPCWAIRLSRARSSAALSGWMPG